MMHKKILSLLSIIALIFIIVACEKQTYEPPIDDGKYPPDSYTLDEKLNWWLEKLTLEEKAGQMIQAERKNGSNGVTPAEVKSLNLGSVLNGGGNVPNPNSLSNWQNMAITMYNAALESSSGIPLIYCADAVYGHNHLQGANTFLHNIGL